MNQIIFGLLICLGLVSINNAQAPESCLYPPSQGNTPPKPELPDVFETRIEINTDRKQSTMRRLFYDFKNRRTSMIDQTSNLETRYIFDYATNEIHVLKAYINETSGSIVDGESSFSSLIVCDSFSLTDTPKLNYYFGYSKLNDSFIVPGSPYKILNFQNDQFYNGSHIIRGIPVDVYVSCQYIAEINANFTATYFFSRFNYVMPSFNPQFTRIPIRAEFIGARLDGNQMVDFKETYDFYEFRVNRSYNEAFQTPQGVLCNKRKMTIPTPNITNQFKFSEEITQDAITSYIRDLVYNEPYQAVRYERRNFRKEPQTFYSTDPLITVHDYNIGVSFTINKYRRNCSITPISVTAFDSDRNFTTNLFNADGSLVLRLKSAKSFLLLDSDYVYTANRRINNVPSKVFISDRSKFTNKSFISEFAFSSDEFTFQENYIKEKNVPVSLWVNKDGDVSYSSFYGYDSSFQNYRPFDVSQCFSSESVFSFRLIFPYKEFATADQLKEEEILEFTAAFMLIANTNESFTRFSRPKISVSEDGNLYVRSSILPPPPPITLFTALPNFWLLNTQTSLLKNVSSAEECAAYCVRDLKCLSFDINIQQAVNRSCYLYTFHHTNGILSSTPNFVHYSRNTLTGFSSRETSHLWSVLREIVDKKKFILPIRLLAPNLPSVNLVAESIEEISNYNNRYGATLTLSKYNIKGPNKKFTATKDRTILNLNIDDCARACNEELGFECLSFDFCYLHGDCRLSKTKVNLDNSEVTDSAECDIYEKDPLYHYQEYPTKSSVNKNDLKYDGIKTSSDCAVKCDKELKIHCRSFNYCPELNACFLSDKHLIDTSENLTQDLVCSHFSRDYLSDFTFTSSANISVDAELVYEGSNLEQCSSLCVTSDGFNCKSFDYCPKTKKCLLNKGLSAKPSSTIKPDVVKDLCNNYKREYFYATSTKINTKTKETKDNTGLIVGLGVGFAVVGIICGGGVMVFYLKKKNKF